MDLTPFTARGFHGEFDRIIATVGVAGIDLTQVQSQIRLCDPTEALLYGPNFSPRAISYSKGSRPILEAIVSSACGSASQRVQTAMDWLTHNVFHPQFAGPTLPNRAMAEEQLIASRVGYCNEQARVFIALCEVMEIPARLCFLWHANGRSAHTATEVLIDGKWAFHDATYRVRVTLPDGTLAEARELRGEFRELAHEAYREPMRRWMCGGHPESAPSDLDPDLGGDFLDSIGICNYLIDGVQEVR